jgi:hypothetical protein
MFDLQKCSGGWYTNWSGYPQYNRGEVSNSHLAREHLLRWRIETGILDMMRYGESKLSCKVVTSRI